MVRIDLGCGNHKREGYIGFDVSDFGQEHIWDARTDRLPFEDGAVDEVFASHFLEHLDGEQIIKLVNGEIHRVLKPGGQAWFVVPHKDHPKAHTVWHKTFFTEFTFRNLLEEVTFHNIVTDDHVRMWEITELVTNERPDIHCKAIKL